MLRSLQAAGVIVVGLLMIVIVGSASAASPLVTEHFEGQTFTLTPSDWHGATDCAIVSATDAYCFDTTGALNAFTSVPRAASGAAIPMTMLDSIAPLPDASGVCNGWDKIWNGINYTDRGLAFEDYGSAQDLSDWVTTPFNVASWFTDGQRGYDSMTNCYGETWDPDTDYQYTNAADTAVADGGKPADYITLYDQVKNS